MIQQIKHGVWYFYVKDNNVIDFREFSGVLLVFSVTPFKQIKIKIKTVQQIKSRIWEMRGGTYTKTLAKIQVRGIFRIRDIRRNVLPKLIYLLLSYFYDPGMFIFRWSSNFVENVVLNENMSAKMASRVSYLVYYYCIQSPFKQFTANYHEPSLDQ